MPSSSRHTTTLDDLLADLIWPRLLRVARLAVRPARVGLGAFYVVGCAAILGLAGSLDGEPNRNLLVEVGGRIGSDLRAAFDRLIAGGEATQAAIHLRSAFISRPVYLLLDAPGALLVGLPLLILWTVILGGALCRTAATEFAIHRTTSWPEALATSVRRWRSLAAAATLPLLVLWLVMLAMSAVGAALFRFPVLNIAGGAAWGAFVLVGLACTILIIGYLLGHPLLVPGVMCDGSDAIDAVQHAYSMALGRPLRLLLYLAVLLVQAALFGILVLLVIHLSVELAHSAAVAWAGARGAAVLGASSPVGDAVSAPPMTDKAANMFVRAWTEIFRAIGYGALVSYAWCAATVLFLAMRRVCDGQEMTELWSPGQIAGASTPITAAIAPAAPGKSEAVEDNGAADEG